MKTKNVFLSMGLAFLMGLAGCQSTGPLMAKAAADFDVYLKPNANWKKDGARFAAYCFNNEASTNTWVDMSQVVGNTNYYHALVDKTAYPKIIFCRMNGSAPENNWENKWNQTGDLSYDGAKNLYTITDGSWDAGSWGTYVEPAPASVYSYSITRGGSPVATDVVMELNTGAEHVEYQSTAAVALQVDDIVSFKKDGAAYAAGAKNDTKVAETNAGLKVVQAGTETLYLDVDEAKLWAGSYIPENGTYLRGVGGQFGRQYQLTMTESSLEGYTMKIENVSLAANETVKVSFYTAENVGNEEAWLDATAVSCDHEAEFPVSIDGEANAKVTNAGHYDLHVNTSSGAYHFIARDYVAPTYTLFAGESSLGQLVLNSGSEYKLLGVSLTAGQVLSYKVNGVAAEGVTAKVVKNNNLTSGLAVLATVASADVYVDVSAKTIWVSGLSNGYHMLVNGATLHTLTHGEDYEGFTQYYSDMVTFAANDVIEFVDVDSEVSSSLPVVFDITTINAGGLGSKFQVAEGHLQAKEAVSAQVYLKLKWEANEVYFGDVPEDVAQATAFATAFNNALKAICKDSGTNVTDLENAWAQQADNTHYGALSADAKLELKTNNTVQEIKDFRAKYELVYGRYTAQLDAKLGGAGKGNFADLDIAESISAVTMPIDNTYIVVLSIAATVTLVGLTAVILRKKKLAK